MTQDQTVLRGFIKEYAPSSGPTLQNTGRHLVYRPLRKNNQLAKRQYILGYRDNHNCAWIIEPPNKRGFAQPRKLFAYAERMYSYLPPETVSFMGGGASLSNSRVQEVLKEMSAKNAALEAMKEAIVIAVKGLTAAAGGSTEEEKGLSEKATGLIAYIDGNDFGCRRNVIKGLVSLLIGENLPLPGEGEENKYWPGGVMVVPTTSGEAVHNYPVNVPALMAKGPIAIRRDGTLGNSIDRKTSSALRLATPEEIDAFFAVLPQSGYTFIFANIKLT